MTKTAFLISMPRAMMLVQSSTFVSLFLNLRIRSYFSVWERSSFLPSTYTFAAIVVLVMFYRYFDYSVVKSLASI